MLLYDDKGNVALDTEEFIRNVKTTQSNELRFGDYLKAYQVECELESEIKDNLERGVKQ